MLEFIVLGQIPGTHFQITFLWYGLALVAALCWILSIIHKRNINQIKSAIKKHIDVITLSNLDQQA
jgi:hypothetical protein